MRITDLLREEHDRFEELLGASLADPERFDHEAFAAFRAMLLRHVAIEEKLLLPAARRLRGGEPLPEAHRIRIEHGALTSLVVPTPDAALAREIRDLLARHEAREEGDGEEGNEGVFAKCEALLGEEESRALAEKARVYPPIKALPHYDGPRVVRTAREALASAERIAPPRRAVVGA